MLTYCACSLPLGNETLKEVILAAAASMTVCNSWLSYSYWSRSDTKNTVYPESVSILRLYYAVYSGGNNYTSSANEVS